jgi:hypothetical protein
MAVQRLTAAYRSRPRPSSTPGAKASTVSPYYLDGERPVHRSVRVELITHIWPYAVFKLHRGTRGGVSTGGLSKLSSVPDGICRRGARSTF